MRTKYDVRFGNEWCKCLRAAPTGKPGWLHYQLKDVTNGLAYNKPGAEPRWRVRPDREVTRG